MKRDKHTLRPYRLWDAHTQKQIMGRWYRWEEHAHDAAVVICRRDTKVGRSVEVLDVRRGRLHATYTKRVSGIEIKKARQLRAEERAHRPVKLRLVS